ncbi:MAG TPA: tripartite tricarboxylate transporter TctB family protein [Hyphomicrobiaceae bacterium]|nr:tripartite tricarboxylate transporter TctB family protein [Hyphomicrobiaceae bacterium]
MSIGREGAASLFFLVFGFAGLWFVRELEVGTAGEMGIGYVPRALSIGCLIIGVILAGLKFYHGRADEAVDFAVRPALFTTALVLLFALLLPRLGLPLTIILIVAAAGISGENYDLRWLAVTALVLATVCTLLFHTLLGLQVPVWPSSAWFG